MTETSPDFVVVSSIEIRRESSSGSFVCPPQALGMRITQNEQSPEIVERMVKDLCASARDHTLRELAKIDKSFVLGTPYEISE